MATHVVTPLQLNLRSAPDPTKNNVILVLPQGTEVTKLANTTVPNWVEVMAELGGLRTQGFVNGRHLAPIGSVGFPQSPVVPSGGPLPAADLGPRPSARRSVREGRAFQIGEPGKPPRPMAHPGGPIAGIAAIIDWMNPGNSAHLRWWRQGATTFCNVYVYDVAMAAGCYIPRVWWTSSAIAKLAQGQTVPVTYGTTVSEMRANMIFDWLEEYGASFGWVREADPHALQMAVNPGRLGIICAQRVNLNQPGHIQIVAPENGNRTAKRVNGKVTQPLQSNAGGSNFTWGQLGNSWWRRSSFREFGFWHAAPG
ncbi:MAG: hypothetical protein ACK4P8_00505 [Tabrizicola sp.]